MVRPFANLFKNHSVYFCSLIRWPSREYYGGKLVCGKFESHQFPVVKGFAWPNNSALAFIDISGKERQDNIGSYSNLSEAIEVARIAENIVAAGSVCAEDIGVITPYAFQRAVIQSEMSKKCKDVEVAIVDAFQGREKR